MITGKVRPLPASCGAAARWASARVLKHYGPPGDQEAGVAFVSPSAIRSLNRKFRGKDRVTDVLSFPLAEKWEGRTQAGDVVICLDRARTQAREAGHSLVREVLILTLHGTLHLLGYDHHGPNPDPMRKAELRLLKLWDRGRGRS